MTHDEEGKIKYGAFCMYPIDVVCMPQDISEWEFYHCPWYLECENWSTALDNFEQNVFTKINTGSDPSTHFFETKLGPKAMLLLQMSLS